LSGLLYKEDQIPCRERSLSIQYPIGKANTQQDRSCALHEAHEGQVTFNEGVVVTICSDQKEAKKCYENSLKNRRSVCHVTTTPPPGLETEQENRQVVDAALEEERNCPEIARESGIAKALIASEKRPRPVGDWLEKEIDGKTFKLGKTLDSETQDQIAKVIGRHLDAFAWSASDMLGINPNFLCHCLAMDPQVKSVQKRRRKFNEERRQAIRDETQKLLAADHIKEI